MANPEKFTVLRMLLRTVGLSEAAIEDIIDRVLDFLSDKDAKDPEQKFPYAIRDDFLSPAELSFYRVLQSVAADWAIICPKVALGDLFFSTINDPSLHRSSTNKIDRKHVDFLLCDRKTLLPLAGIELDDKSHNRADRQVRDEFVNGVFSAAKLPLIRVPAQSAYSTAELKTLLRDKVGVSDYVKPAIQEPIQQTEDLQKKYGSIPMPSSVPVPSQIQMAASIPVPSATPKPASIPAPSVPNNASIPSCPKCGGEMILRTAKTGNNAGGKFWGCANYPRCRSVVEYKP